MNLEILDPPFIDWFTPQRKESLVQCFQSSYQFLVGSDLIDLCFKSWVKNQVYLEALSNHSIVCSEDFEKDWDSFFCKLKKDEVKDLMLRYKTEENLKYFQLRKNVIAKWSSFYWKHKLETLYLKYKHDLDKVTCSLIRVSSQPLALELYHRIIAGESSFEEVARNFGECSESRNSGLIKNQSLKNLPDGLAPLLSSMECGEVLKPYKIGKYFAVVRLEHFLPAVFSEELEDDLLLMEFDQWLNAVAAQLHSKMCEAYVQKK